MIHLLEEEKYDALVLDTPVLQYKEGTDTHCVLFVMGESFEMFSLAVVFPPNSNQTLVDSLSVSMVRQQVSNRGFEIACCCCRAYCVLLA